MSQPITADEIIRIETARNKIRTKFNELGLVEPAAKIDTLATAAENIENKGAVSATVKEGETYTIPKGYHNGSGTVAGVGGGGNYNLQSKGPITPNKTQQSITPDSGYYGLSDVTINPIPSNYQDVSSVTAQPEHVLANKIIVTPEGKVEPGTMLDNGAVNKVLDVDTPSFEIPEGYHNGDGAVSIATEERTATPLKEALEIKANAGKVISKVTVEPIPEQYIDTTGATAKPSSVLDGDTFFANGKEEVGTMTNNGDVSRSFDGLVNTSVVIPEGYTSGGTVTLTEDIANALAAI